MNAHIHIGCAAVWPGGRFGRFTTIHLDLQNDRHACMLNSRHTCIQTYIASNTRKSPHHAVMHDDRLMDWRTVTYVDGLVGGLHDLQAGERSVVISECAHHQPYNQMVGRPHHQTYGRTKTSRPQGSLTARSTYISSRRQS